MGIDNSRITMDLDSTTGDSYVLKNVGSFEVSRNPKCPICNPPKSETMKSKRLQRKYSPYRSVDSECTYCKVKFRKEKMKWMAANIRNKQEQDEATKRSSNIFSKGTRAAPPCSDGDEHAVNCTNFRDIIKMSDEDLTDWLKRFYHNEVNEREKEAQVAKMLVISVLEDISINLSPKLEDLLGLKMGYPFITNIDWEGLKDVTDEFECMLPIIMDSSVWKYSTLCGVSPGYKDYVISSNSEQLDSWNGKIASAYGYFKDSNVVALSPMTMKLAIGEQLKIILQSDSSYSIENDIAGPLDYMHFKIHLKIHLNLEKAIANSVFDMCGDPTADYMYKAYKRYSKKSSISINIFPVIKLKEGNSEKLFYGEGSAKYNADTWREFFSPQVKQIINDLSCDGNSHLKILRILKAMKRGNVFSLPFDFYHLKIAIIKEGHNGDWHGESLGKKFKEMLRYLEECLKMKCLSHVLEGGGNLLRELGLEHYFNSGLQLS